MGVPVPPSTRESHNMYSRDAYQKAERTASGGRAAAALPGTVLLLMAYHRAAVGSETS